MVRSKIQKDLLKMFKNVKKMSNQAMKSTYMLYLILILAVSNLFVFITNQDNESLFLFLIISSLVYMKTTNMICVLLIPLISVNVLIYLRSILMGRREGFDTDIQEFTEWFKTNVVDVDAPPDEDKEGKEFYDKTIKPVLDIEEQKMTTIGNMEKMLTLYTKLNEMNEKSQDGNESDSEYIKNMVVAFRAKFSDTETTEGDNKKTTESFKFSEGYEDEEDEEEEDEEDEEDEEGEEDQG